MEEMAAAACDAGMEVWGFTPHSPICVESPCNMDRDDVPKYIAEADRLRELYTGRMEILTGMEVDYMSRDFGPHIDYFQKLPLDYRIGSVHFVPTQEGVALDCDGSFERFKRYLHDGYQDDLRYVVERYFEQVLTMLELGGFEILGHFDKIAGNASMADPTLEDQSWYEALVDDVISHALTAGVLVEINTKSIYDKSRYFPAQRWWQKLRDATLPLVVNSDAHYTEKVNLGREDCLKILKEIK
jgi:histidinol-phosphatase (PHP family)